MSRGRPAHPWRLLTSLAVFVAVSTVLTLVVVNSVLNLDSRSGSTYHAVVRDAADLRTGDGVKIAGLDVGRITDVHLQHDNLVKLTFTVASGNKVYGRTDTAVRYANLVGTRYLALVAPAQGSAGAVRPVGSTIPASNNIPSIDLTAVFNGFQPLFDALDPTEINQLTASIIDVFQGQSGTVASLVEQVGTITENLAGRKLVIQKVVTSLAGLLTSVNTQSDALDSIIGNFSKVVGNLSGQRQLLAQAIDGLAQFSTSASGLVHESAPSIDAAIGGVAAAARTLATSQAAINGLLGELPITVAALNRVLDAGGFAKVYLCNLTIKTTGRLNISLVPGLAAPQDPKDFVLPSGVVADPSKMGGICR
jgi:phospholipid/cholesterol/gamma-HCH transport system substrate-binding protein